MWLSLSWYGGETRFERKLPATRGRFSVSFYSPAQTTPVVTGDSEGVSRNADSDETALVSDYYLCKKKYAILYLSFRASQVYNTRWFKYDRD
jgi:hypothetical protein